MERLGSPATGAAVRSPEATLRRAHRSFALVLSGGGARGLAHVGVLRALEHLGYRPSGIVGVSMGAIVGATYLLNHDWYQCLLHLDLNRLPGAPNGARDGPVARLQSAVASGVAVGHLLLRWGTWTASESTIRALLNDLTLGKDIDQARLPFAAIATDLCTERRCVIDRGNAADAIYASSALAGILPPHRQGDALLVDGVYADGAPVDVARAMEVDAVVAVDVSQRRAAAPPRNGLQTLARAMEIVHRQGSRARFGEADLVLAPAFGRQIASLDFGHHRGCIAAGVRSVLAGRGALAELLEPRQPSVRSANVAAPEVRPWQRS